MSLLSMDAWKENLAARSTRWNQLSAKRALDELFDLTLRFRSSESYLELVRFMGRFRFYAPFNAMLIHVQMPGATFVAPPSRWLHEYRRCVAESARPIVILQPRGPVMFVFDVSDTEPLPGAKPLPRAVTDPFAVRSGDPGAYLYRTVENAMRDGVEVRERSEGSQLAGTICSVDSGRTLVIDPAGRRGSSPLEVPLRYELILNARHPPAVKYATLAHELGHLYCGHIGTPDDRWWPERRGLPLESKEFEAESASYLVCSRIGIDTPSEEYLADYTKSHRAVPLISLETVTRAAGLIEAMGRERLPLRKKREGPW